MRELRRYWEFPIGDDLVVAHPDVHGLLLLNSTARFIWSEARSDVKPEDIAASLVAVYGISPEQALSDVEAVLNCAREQAALSRARERAPSAVCGPRETPSQFLYYRLHGKLFEIGLNSDDIRDEIAPRLAHLESGPGTPDFRLDLTETAEAYTLWHGKQCLGAEDSVGAIRALLLQELVRLSEPGREWLALLHAGACAWRDQAIILPAASHSGKTTLAAVLMAEGFSLVSDDFVGIERGTLRLPTMPFALGIREGSWPLLAGHHPELRQCPVLSRFGEQVKFLAPPPGPVEPVQTFAIVSVRWSSAASATTWERISTLETLATLKDSGFWVQHEEQSIRIFLDWLQRTPTHRMIYSEVNDAVTKIRSIMEAR